MVFRRHVTTSSSTALDGVNWGRYLFGEDLAGMYTNTAVVIGQKRTSTSCLGKRLKYFPN